MLRRGLIALLAGVVLAGAAAAQMPFPADTTATAPQHAPVDTTVVSETHNLLDLGISGRDAWYVRGFDSLFARDEPGLEEAARSTTARIDAAFLPYAGQRIRHVVILGREAFGTLVADTTASMVEDAADTLETSTSTFTSLLNAVTTGTQTWVIRNYLLFSEGEVVDPYALADSERLLRELSYTSDVKIEILAVPGLLGVVDVYVLVRDRWPLGAKAKIHTRDRYDVEVFHRNLAGLGLNLEFEVPYERGRSPETGWRAKGAIGNLGGSFVDLSAEVLRLWSRDRNAVAIERRFAHPDVRLTGGLALAKDKVKDNPDLPPALRLDTEVRDAWLGWGFRLGTDDPGRHERRRLVPALRVEWVDFVRPPLEYAESERQWRDVTRYLGQLTFLGIDYYTARLVYGYGETEDLPSGVWAALSAGFETGEIADRLYHGLRFLWPSFTTGDRYVTLALGFGGFRRGGRFEDGVLDIFIGGFAPLRQQSYGAWRHFYGLAYTAGINRNRDDGLRLDAVSLRDLEDESVAGNHRLAAESESVLFTRYALLGFKIAAFGYAAAGFVGDEDDLLAHRRLNLNLTGGLRFNNPRLVFPTIEMRVGLVSTVAGTEPVVSVSMGDVGFLRKLVPSVKPGTIPFI